MSHCTGAKRTGASYGIRGIMYFPTGKALETAKQFSLHRWVIEVLSMTSRGEMQLSGVDPYKDTVHLAKA